jgi:hypothetical protein
MIVDARKMHHPDLRPYTVKSAIAEALDHINVGQSVAIEKVLDARGREADLPALAMNVSKVKGNRRFTIRSDDGGALATITRIA